MWIDSLWQRTAIIEQSLPSNFQFLFTTVLLQTYLSKWITYKAICIEHSKRNQLLSSDINFKVEIRHHWVKLYRYHNLHSKITAHEVQIIKHYKTFHIKDNQCRISWQDTWYQFPYFNFEALAEQSADVLLQDDFGTYLYI